MEKALLRLFNAVQTENESVIEKNESYLIKTVKSGFVCDPRIKLTLKTLKTIESIVGISGEKANAAFHKSWRVIEDTPQEELWLQAIVHYMTTYGFQSMGIYSEDTIYIPREQLDIPGITEGISLRVVKAMTKADVLTAIVALAGTGIALGQDTLDDIMSIVIANEYDSEFVSSVKNRELASLLRDHYGIVPTDPVEFLRYVLVNLCEESLVIKNKYLINKIKESNGKHLDLLMAKAPENMASVFFRFKPLFLAMKSISRNKVYYNRLRKQANTMHVPVKMSYLDRVTANIKNGRLDIDKLGDSLENASIFRKIKLAYALRTRMNSSDSIVYKVRNGKSWVTDFKWGSKLGTKTQVAFNAVLDSIVSELAQSVDGETIYIPKGVVYALPATEKQFTGAFPTGSYIAVPEDLIVGIHWTNTDRTIDLDLSLVNKGEKIGWNSNYRSGDGSYLYSGDLTSAPKPNGATELFYAKKQGLDPMLLTVNYYNYTENSPVPSKIIIGSEKAENFGASYMIDPNNILATPNIVVDKKQTVLGLMANVDGENRFYISKANIGGGNVASTSGRIGQTVDHMMASLMGSINLNSVLSLAGANIVEEMPDGEFINLDPSVLDKNSIIGILSKISSPVS